MNDYLTDDELAVDLTFWQYRNGMEPIPVRVRLCWELVDPTAIHAIFRNDHNPGCDVEWVFDRSLIADGVDRRVGDGDIRIGPSPLDPDDNEARTAIELSSPSGHAEFTVTTEPLAGFVAATFLRVPEGCESRFVDVDSELEELLRSAA